MASAATGQARVALASSAVAEGGARSALPKPASFQHSGVLQRKCGCEGPGSTFGECAECKAERAAPLQRKSAGAREQGREPDEIPPIVHEVLRSPGQPLDAATRAFMEPRFGHDFSGVRVHTNAKGAEAASSINARAFTSNHSIVFGTRAYAPQTESGLRLLAHELTHVVQQADGACMSSHGPNFPPQLGDPEASAEHDASRAADEVVRGGIAQVISLSDATTVIRREPLKFSSQQSKDDKDRLKKLWAAVEATPIGKTFLGLGGARPSFVGETVRGSTDNSMAATRLF